MKKTIFPVILTLMLGVASETFVRAEETGLLPNGGFEEFQSGNEIPVKGWKFNYNMDVKGKFIEDSTFNGQGSVLEVINPLDDKGITLRNAKGGYFEIKESGKYLGSVWIKAGADAQTIPKKKLSIMMRTIRTDWKKAFHDAPRMLRKDWLKYEYEFYVPEKDIGEYFFRIDIFGSGTFFIAKPSIMPVNEETAKKKVEGH